MSPPVSCEGRARASYVHKQHLKRGAALSIAIKTDCRVQVVYGEGGGCTLQVVGEAASVWIPLRGSLQLHGNGLNRSVHAGDVLITEIDNDVKAIGHADGRWLAVIGGKRAWEQVLNDVSANHVQLFPDLHEADRDLRRMAIAVVRASSALQLEGAVHAVADRIVGLQAPLHQAMARCPGRTLARKHQVFLRLQRIRNYVSAFCNQDLDNETLALMANFSPCYFLRTFRAVYLETPHSYLINQRLQRAKYLLRSSDLAITEVAWASGFENRCVFSRTFHRRFGVTAMEAKRRATALAVAG